METQATADGRQPVDDFELAERLSYFLWADMPDERLLTLAGNGTLSDHEILSAEVDRLLASAKAHRLADVFAVEWLTLNEIEHVSNNPPVMLRAKDTADRLYALLVYGRSSAAGTDCIGRCLH